MEAFSLSELEIRKLRLHQAFEQRLGRGVLPYEGEWLVPDDIRRRQRENHARARVQFWEVLVGVAALGLIGGFFLFLALTVIY